MALPINVNRRGPSNEMRHLRIYQKKKFYLSFSTNKTERFSFKSGCVVQVKNGEMHCQL